MSTSRARNHTPRAVSVVVAVALLAIGGWSGRGAIAQVDGDTYTNPTYAYQIQWDEAVWEVVGDTPGDLALESDVAEIYFQSGQFYEGDAIACLDDLVERLPDDDTVVSVVPFEGEGELEAESDGRAFSTLEVVVEDEDEERTVVERIDCRTVVAGEAVLAITWIAPVDGFDAANEATEALLASLVIPSFQDPDAGAAGVDGDNYTDPDYGFSLAWDGGDWAPFVPVDALFGLNSGSSLISFDLPREFDGDAAACVESSLERRGASNSIVGVTPIEVDSAPVAGTDDAGWTYAAVDVDYGGTRQFVEIRCAALPGEDVTLRAVHSGAIDTYETEAGRASVVFASLTLADQAEPTAEAPAGTPPSDGPVETPDPETGTPGAGASASTPVPNVPASTPGATPEANVPAGDLTTFAPDEGGWSLVYDDAFWSPLDPAIYSTVDLALSGELTVVTFDSVPTNGSTAEELVAAIVSTEILALTGDEESVEPLDAPSVDAFEGAVAEAYAFVTVTGAEVAMAVIAIPLSDETAIVIRGYAGADGFGTEEAAFEALLDGLEG